MAVSKTPAAPSSFVKDLFKVEKDMTALMRKAEGSPAREEIGERNPPTIQNHMRAAYRGLSTTYGPTPLHRKKFSYRKRNAGRTSSRNGTNFKNHSARFKRKIQTSGELPIF